MAINTNYSVILDAARMEHEMAIAQKLNSEGVSLFREDPEDLAEVAPYLFNCIEKSQFYNWVLNTGWGKAWGIFCITTIDFNELRRHFRRFLMVKTEDGLQLYFRFYDPRVLRIFLPTCDAFQLREFFGPITRFICEDEDPEFALVFFHDNTKLITQRVPVREIFTDISYEKITPLSTKEPKEEEENIVSEQPKIEPKIETKEKGSDDINKSPEPPSNDDPEKPKSRFKFY